MEAVVTILTLCASKLKLLITAGISHISRQTGGTTLCGCQTSRAAGPLNTLLLQFFPGLLYKINQNDEVLEH